MNLFYYLIERGIDMPDIFDRIEQIRSASNLSLRAFGDKLGVSYGAVANIKYKNVEKPSDILIKSICREFNVNRYWLETGEGEAYIRKETDDELAQQIRVVMKGRKDFAVAVLSALASMPDEYWDAFHEKVKEAYDAMKKEEDN